ncbi:hypothetical protein JTE90_001555 [Oedothorax gibbosus]|uniref:Hydroxylysine kinase n=1 Tax=Oedothorax gibbosus TaxID=931172 RepID=A0AAV6VLV4_9ARAC|nr:hypothetical protein JTE90_001555 [Oedothorax gibbosus]
MSNTEPSNSEVLGKIISEMFKPHVSKELAIELASRLYGFEVTEIKPLNSFSDQNFLIKVSKHHQNPHIEEISDEGYVLKIINTYKSKMENHFESVHAGIIHLFKKGLRVPLPIKNLEGKTWTLERVPLQEKEERKANKDMKCGIHLLTYIPGVPMATFKNTADNFFEWGKLLAEFHSALEDLDCPSLKTKDIFSNVKFFSNVGAFLESQEDQELKTLVHNVLERYPSELLVHLNNVPQGYLHGDFNDHNVLAQLKHSAAAAEYRADGILDFDDLHYGALVWDLGLMLGHVPMVDKDIDDLEAAGHAVAGYRSVRHLNELEMSLVKICMECRLSMMTFVSIATKDDPNNSYIQLLAATEPKRNMLKRLAKINVDELLDIWNRTFRKHNIIA